MDPLASTNNGYPKSVSTVAIALMRRRSHEAASDVLGTQVSALAFVKS